MNRPSRRCILHGWSLLPSFAGAAGSASPYAAQAASAPSSKGLVAYYSRSGNTRVIAGRIRRAYTADLFEITTAVPYPEDYDETVRQARRERDTGFQPALGDTVATIASYDVVFLGFPIWGTTVPPAIRSFLSRHDLAGKTLVPFITHGGYGRGNSLAVIRAHAPAARQIEGFALQSDQERQTLERVNRWLGSLDLPR